MSKRFENKVCIVTGATSGIGRAVAVQLGREGGCVAILGRSIDAGREVVREIKAAGGEAVFVRTDVGKDAQLQAAVRRTLARWHRIE